MMLLSDVGRGLSLAALMAGILLGSTSLWLVSATTVTESSCSVVFSLAETASLPQAVEPQQLPATLNANQSLFAIAFLLGPPVGGLLVAIQPLLPFALDAASFALSVITLLLSTTPFQGARPAHPATARHLLREIGDGMRWLWREPRIRQLTLLNSLTAFALGASALVIIRLVAYVLPLAQQFALPAYTGVILACGGIGGLLGTGLCAYLLRRVPAPVLLCVSLWLQGAIFSLLIVAHGARPRRPAPDRRAVDDARLPARACAPALVPVVSRLTRRGWPRSAPPPPAACAESPSARAAGSPPGRSPASGGRRARRR
jgi:MFS family permease